MERINAAVSRLDGKGEHEGSSLLERVLERTGDPKIAATMALDLLLVGIDTVSLDTFIFYAKLQIAFPTKSFIFLNKPLFF